MVVGLGNHRIQMAQVGQGESPMDLGMEEGRMGQGESQMELGMEEGQMGLMERPMEELGHQMVGHRLGLQPVERPERQRQ